MAEIAPGGGSGTGGFIGQGICVPSPSDLAGAIDNLLNRIKTLEDQMANVLGANLHADQLSDIAAQVGWVYGLTYAGVGGWIQTAGGTLIPPAGMSLSSLGFTMSDGNQYPMVVMDANGVLQFGFTQQGDVNGEQSPGAGNYISFNTLSGSPGAALDLGAISQQEGSAFSWNAGAPTTLNILQKGLYAYSLVLNGTSADLNDTETFYAQQQFGYPFTFTPNGVWGAVVDEDGDFFIGATVLGVVTNAPCTFRVVWNGADDPLAALIQGSLTVAKLQKVA